jgi:hypothetical protein
LGIHADGLNDRNVGAKPPLRVGGYADFFALIGI